MSLISRWKTKRFDVTVEKEEITIAWINAFLLINENIYLTYLHVDGVLVLLILTRRYQVPGTHYYYYCCYFSIFFICSVFVRILGADSVVLTYSSQIDDESSPYLLTPQ